MTRGPKHTIKNIVALLVLARVILAPHNANALSIEDAISLSVKHSTQTKHAAAQIEVAEGRLDAIEGAFDWRAFGNLALTDDQAEPLSSFAGKSAAHRQVTFGLQKMLPTGTQVQTSLTQNYTKTRYDNTPPPPGTPLLPQASRFNPAYANQFELKVSQPLLKNFATQQIKLQSKIASQETLYRSSSLQKVVQDIQMQTAELYWQLSGVNRQIQLARDLVDKSKEFARFMKQRVQLGRADEIDNAAAESSIIGHETRLLQLELVRDQLTAQLNLLIAPDANPHQVKNLSSDLATTEGDLPFKNAQEALAIVRERHADFIALRIKRDQLTNQSILIKEQHRASLDVFASVQSKGLDDTASESWADASQLQKNNTSTIGLEFSVPLQTTQKTGELRSALAEIKSLEYQEQALQRSVQTQAEILLLQYRGATKQLNQAKRQLASLARQKREESRKLSQARSDEVAVVRYEIEILAALIEELNAMVEKKLAESKIKHLAFAFPKQNL